MKETRNIVENTLLEHEWKYGTNYRRSVKVKCVAKFLNEIKNETQNMTIERYNIFGEVNKTMQSSDGMCKVIRIIELKIKIERGFYENVIDLHLKREIIPSLWKKTFIKIANDRDNL